MLEEDLPDKLNNSPTSRHIIPGVLIQNAKRPSWPIFIQGLKSLDCCKWRAQFITTSFLKPQLSIVDHQKEALQDFGTTGHTIYTAPKGFPLARTPNFPVSMSAPNGTVHVLNPDTYLNHLPAEGARNYEVCRNVTFVVLGVRQTILLYKHTLIVTLLS